MLNWSAFDRAIAAVKPEVLRVRDGDAGYLELNLKILDRAEHLARELAVTANNRDKLRQYILDLSTTKEQEIQVMNEEAQRCRGMISKQADPPSRRNRTVTPTSTKGARP